MAMFRASLRGSNQAERCIGEWNLRKPGVRSRDTLFCLGESFFLTRRQADFTGFVPMSVLGSLADMSGCVKKASALPLKADILRGGW